MALNKIGVVACVILVIYIPSCFMMWLIALMGDLWLR